MNDYQLNTKYKDRLFRLIFHDKKELLELYNAVNESHYTNPEDLEITTIEDVVYIWGCGMICRLLSETR